MTSRLFLFRLQTVCAIAAAFALAITWTTRFRLAHAASASQAAPEPSFDQLVKPFLKQNCVRCHNENVAMSGVRLDQLDAALEERHLQLWEHVRTKISDGTMPPKGQPQPASADRQRLVEWITRSLDFARFRPVPKNGLVRRLTVSQYRNTIRQLLMLEDDLTESLPPDAVSSDGFINDKETLQLSPLQLEGYFDIAEQALSRSIVDPNSKPAIQNFKVSLGESVNPNPFPEPLILGAGSTLLENKDVEVTQPIPVKPFAFKPIAMRTKYRFIEGYKGNDTVRGWREYDSIYHAVFADMRGSAGYPKGKPYSTIPEGLLLRPSIPNDEIFGTDGTYGPKANFKISLRELPDHGRFRVSVMAAKFNDGLLLDAGVAAQALGNADAIVVRDPKLQQIVTIKKAGIYQVDVYNAERTAVPAAAEPSMLSRGLSVSLPLNGEVSGGRLEGEAKFVDSPFGKAVSLNVEKDSVVIPRQETMNVGDGDFTVSAWIHPRQLRRAGIVGMGAPGKHGWYLDMPNRGALRFESFGLDRKSNGTISSPVGTIRANDWQHVAAVVRRGKSEARLYVNGYAVAKGEIGAVNLDNPAMALRIGHNSDDQQYKGELDEVRLYRRALSEAEIQVLVDPGRQFVKPPPPEKTQELSLTIGDRQFAGTSTQPAFLAIRLDAGPIQLNANGTSMTGLDRLVLTPLAENQDAAKRFLAFEKRTPKLGVHLGLRRDCGSTFAPVGAAQAVASSKLTRFVFEGAIRNYPSPDVEKDNVNYLAGVREIAVRSEYTDGRDIPRLLIRSVEFEGPFYETWPPASHKSIFFDSAHKNDSPAYAKEIIRSFATRAYRRPVTPAEETALFAVFQKSSGAGRNFQESIKDTLQVTLTSPQFLFLIENSLTPAPEPIDGYELASKLSYFLWNGPPDRKTLQLAASGTLRKQLDSEVGRMVEDQRFSQLINEFASQWLSLDKFQVLEPDRKRYPKLTQNTRNQLRQEPIQFLQYLMKNNLPLKNLIDSDFIVANEAVASYYDLAEKTESGLQFLPILHGRRELGGVLTQAAIMAGLSDGRESNPVKRGAWLARKIIAEPPDPPPPNVPALKEDDSLTLTLRQRIERHRNQPGCQQCHAKIDPWGVAFEEFDAGGRLKAQATDARSTLPDKTEIAGANDLKRYLAQDRIDQVAFSFLKHLATYGTGRSLTYGEVHFLKQDALKLKAGGYRMKDMVRYVASSKLFLEK